MPTNATFHFLRGKNKGGVSKQQYKKNQQRRNEEGQTERKEEKKTKRERKREKGKFNVSAHCWLVECVES